MSTFVCVTADLHPYECGGVLEGCPHCRMEQCKTCSGSGIIAVAGPDENGMYDTDDCPTCSR